MQHLRSPGARGESQRRKGGSLYWGNGCPQHYPEEYVCSCDVCREAVLWGMTCHNCGEEVHRVQALEYRCSVTVNGTHLHTVCKPCHEKLTKASSSQATE